MNKKQAVGRWGEKVAENFLASKGWVLLTRNHRTPYGEIDLVMQDGADIVFIEVKTRTNDSYGLPETSVTSTKRRHMIAAAEAYMQLCDAHPDAWRIDVISIRGAPDCENPEIVWFENAVA
jgi:putative endonuclease